MEEFELESGEHVILSLRKHWFVFFIELLPFALLALLPLFFPALAGGFATASPQAAAAIGGFSMLNPWFRLFLGIWWLILWILAFNIFTQYFLNHWVFTNKRIVNIHQHGFFDRHVSSFFLIRVQDVSTDVSGLFATLLHYGTIKVQTAGGDTEHDFEMTGVPDPTGMRDLIMKEVAGLHDSHPGVGV